MISVKSGGPVLFARRHNFPLLLIPFTFPLLPFPHIDLASLSLLDCCCRRCCSIHSQAPKCSIRATTTLLQLPHSQHAHPLLTHTQQAHLEHPGPQRQRQSSKEAPTHSLSSHHQRSRKVRSFIHYIYSLHVHSHRPTPIPPASPHFQQHHHNHHPDMASTATMLPPPTLKEGSYSNHSAAAAARIRDNLLDVDSIRG